MSETERGHGMWGGRFDGEPDALFCALNDSLPVDWRLVERDIAGSIAWAEALGAAGVLSPGEVERLTRALDALRAEAGAGAAPPVASGAEDVHTWVERRLVDELGALGKKLHTGRSRNDQVATDLRMWTRDAIDRTVALAGGFQAALLDVGAREVETVFPAYTHLQPAQPVTFGHWCLAYVEMLERDVGRLEDARTRVNVCPLGSGALAGTTYAVDRAEIAAKLGFTGPTANSLDAVSDRDYVIETAGALALIAVHLSRLAEDLIIYGSSEFGLVQMDDGVTSGSSLMPQKKNPDAAELLRGKCGRVIGAHTSLLVTLKAQALSYNKDLQEDKEPLFDAVDTVGLCLRIARRVVEGLAVNRDRAHAAAMRGCSNATDLADAMVEAGVPFREAHERVGTLVRRAIARGVALEDLPLDALREVCPELDAGVHARLTASSMLARRDVVGGTAPDRVRAALDAARRRLAGRSGP